MNIIKTVFFSALFLCIFSYRCSASTEVKIDNGHSVIGYISVDGKTTVDDVSTALRQKAQAAHATAFRITHISGNNQLHGNAILLK